MSDHKCRKGYDIDPFAEWVRRELPGSREGIVRMDLDTALRRYGHNYGLDSTGDLMLVEQKAGDEEVTWGEKYVYGWLNRAISGADYKNRWRGRHVLRIRYASYPSPCTSCGRPIETSDEAYARFVGASLEWDDKPATHDELKTILLGEQFPPNEEAA